MLRDAGGAPQGMLRMLVKWRYPFQAPEGATGGTRPETRRGERQRDSQRRREEAEETQRPIAKPRLKVNFCCS